MGNLGHVIKEVIGDRLFYALKDNRLKIRSCFEREESLYKLVKVNQDLCNIHVGERCFILGNGPSLKKIDFKLLRDEFVFTVNYFNMVDNFQDAKTNVHIWMDLNTFDMRPEVKEDPELLRRNFEDIAKENPLCFIPAAAYPYVKKTELDKMLNLRYVTSNKSMLDKEIIDVDLSKGIYGSATVVQSAIQIAIYMGFSKIYLLGCDSTNILTHLNTILGQTNTSLHAYSSTVDNAESATKELMQSWNTNQFIFDHYIIFRGYELLNNYCIKHGVELINCSEPTLITEIPQRRFSAII